MYIKKFSSGPVFKGKHWNLDRLSDAMVGRLHRSPDGVKHVQYMITLIKKALDIPEDYRVAIIGGSTTGAMSALTWQMFGVKDITCLVWDIFASDWSDDVKNLYDSNSLYGCKNVYRDSDLHDYNVLDNKVNVCRIDGLSESINFGQSINFRENLNIEHNDTDLLLTWTSTATGQRPSSWDFLKKYKERNKDNNKGCNQERGKESSGKEEFESIVVCDLAATAFIEPIDWSVIDAGAFSLQKGLGGEPGLGVVVLSPAAYARLYRKIDHVVPKLFRLQLNDKPNDLFFNGHATNTISMLVLEDGIKQLEYILELGIEKWYEKAEQNKNAAIEFVKNSEGLEFVYDNMSLQSCTSICVKPKQPKTIEQNTMPSVQQSTVQSISQTVPLIQGLNAIWNEMDKKKQWELQWELIREIELTGGLHDIIGHTRMSPCWRFWIGPTMETEDLIEGLKLLNDIVLNYTVVK